MIVNDASTINVIDDASLALASVVNYDHKWCYNLERHFDDTRSVNYDRNTFIIQATGHSFLHNEINYDLKKFCDTGPWSFSIYGVASVTDTYKF